jgi:ribonuclease VapC
VIAVDASAVLAILLGEPEGARFRAALRVGGRISAVNHWEVLARAFSDTGAAGAARAEALMAELGVEVAAVDAADSRAAHQAFARFGKGRGGPLNLGDCFAYALAQREGAGLLYKGDDFARTDVMSALA